MDKLNIKNFKTSPSANKHISRDLTHFYNIKPVRVTDKSGDRVQFHVPIVNLDFYPRFKDIPPFFKPTYPAPLLLVRRLTIYFPSSVLLINFFRSNTSAALHVAPKSLHPFVLFLKNSIFFKCSALMDIWGTDFPTRRARFEVTYYLLSPKKNERVFVRSFFAEWDVLPSLTSLFKSANWLEREIWDLFGIPFSGHPDLRRILTDYGFLGFPLRKDFPLTGFYELRYDDAVRRVISESINLLQELRLFFFSTPWRKK